MMRGSVMTQMNKDTGVGCMDACDFHFDLCVLLARELVVVHALELV